MRTADYLRLTLGRCVAAVLLFGLLAVCGRGVCSADETPADDMGIVVTPFGKLSDGSEVNRYLLKSRGGMEVEVIDFGAAVIAVRVPDAHGKLVNVALHFDSLADYEKNAPYFGVICGRYAGRIGGGRFTLDGREYQLATNDPPNHEHGGSKGFSRVLWTREEVQHRSPFDPTVILRYRSPAGDEGYPGELDVKVGYTLTEGNALIINYAARATEATPVNLTSHVYWNLAGEGDVLAHVLRLAADEYLVADPGHLPTGEIRSVRDTPMDFTTKARIGARIAEVEGGYDHCYALRAAPDDNKFRHVAHVFEPQSGRVMDVLTTEPGVQFYTGNYLDGSESSGGYAKHGGFCLECQHFPDSPNQPNFPNTILRPGQLYRQTTIYHFPTIATP